MPDTAAPSSSPAPSAPASAPNTSEPRARPGDFHATMAAKDAEFAKRVRSERAAPAQTEREHISEMAAKLIKQPEAPPQDAAIDPNAEVDDDGLEAPAAPIDERTALEKYKQWSDSPDLPDDFKTKLVEVKWGPHGTKLVTVDEAVKGYQRLGDSTRAYQEVQKREKQFKDNEAHYQTHFEAIRDPDQFLEIYERNGFGDVLYQVAASLARREQADNQLIEAAGYAAMRQHQCQANDYRVQQAMEGAKSRLGAQRGQEVQMRQLQAERDRLLQARTQVDEQAQVKELGERFRQQLQQLVPIALKAHGIKDTPVNRSKHHRHLTDLMQASGGSEITRQVVMDASEMLLEELHDARGPAPSNGHGKPISPNRLGTGTGAPRTGTTSQPKGARMSDFKAAMDRKNRGQ